MQGPQTIAAPSPRLQIFEAKTIQENQIETPMAHGIWPISSLLVFLKKSFNKTETRKNNKEKTLKMHQLNRIKEERKRENVHRDKNITVAALHNYKRFYKRFPKT